MSGFTTCLPVYAHPSTFDEDGGCLRVGLFCINLWRVLVQLRTIGLSGRWALVGRRQDVYSVPQNAGVGCTSFSDLCWALEPH